VAIKCELAFLCRTGALSSPLPGVRWIACVRNPFATIAGWKTKPQTEFDIAIGWTLRSVRPWLTPESLAQLERVAGLADLAEKRAAWWWWLAQRLLERSEGADDHARCSLFGGRDEIAVAARRPGAPARKQQCRGADHPARQARPSGDVRYACRRRRLQRRRLKRARLHHARQPGLPGNEERALLRRRRCSAVLSSSPALDGGRRGIHGSLVSTGMCGAVCRSRAR
jgi:hypothetical protein